MTFRLFRKTGKYRKASSKRVVQKLKTVQPRINLDATVRQSARRLLIA